MKDLIYLPVSLQVLVFVLLFFVGSCIFSFLNVVIYRVPKGLNFVKGRSFCPSCGHGLAAKDLVPILSWLCLRGKCRYCKAKISARYTIVEFAGGIAAVGSVIIYGISPKALLAFAVIAFALIIALVDHDTMEIPNGFVIGMVVLAVSAVWIFPEITLAERGIGAFAVSLPMFLLALAIPGAFGGGDIKLMLPVGFLLGWKNTLLAAFLAILLGGIYGAYLLFSGKKEKKDHFAFGPFLCIGMIFALFWGTEILKWYLSFFMNY